MPYKSKAIQLFQKIDGVDLCLFSMYVQEYDKDSPEPNSRRVYIAYLDSVEYFRPRTARTQVYHEILVSYLLWSRLRGFRVAHIWACPPQRGNNFIFWCHPQHQKTPSKDRLIEWYRKMLERAKQAGAVHASTNLYAEYFAEVRELVSKGEDGFQAPCPPLFDGDFWVDETCRLYNIMQRRKAVAAGAGNQSQSAKQLCQNLIKTLREHPSASPFNVPVDPVIHCALDYFDVIKHPMDLATALAKLKSGQYRAIRHFKDDIELVFANATKYNPPMHAVHQMALKLREIFRDEFQKLLGMCIGRERATEQEMNKVALLESIRMSDTIHPLPMVEEPSLSLEPTTVESPMEEMTKISSEGIVEPPAGVPSTHPAAHPHMSKSLQGEVSKSVERLKADLLVLFLQPPDNQQAGDMIGPEVPSYAQDYIADALSCIKFGDTTDPVSDEGLPLTAIMLDHVCSFLWWLLVDLSFSSFIYCRMLRFPMLWSIPVTRSLKCASFAITNLIHSVVPSIHLPWCSTTF